LTSNRVGFFFTHISWFVTAFVVSPEQSSMPTKRNPKDRTWRRQLQQTSLLESTYSSFFSIPQYIDKEDKVWKIKEAANELIVLSKSTLGDGDVGEYSATSKHIGDTLVSTLRCSTRFSKSVSSASSP
jgi:hypothetical protein